ncbi:phthiocerol/phthiodiolone dimycocerosyl transferase family protein [Cystobacter ferrugineus]|uniref:Phthiocerol/phthiodiolone dimycocerosyl transferase n=1 Tax=Cystobacter ferrugineus TaxID=83449 RepID=A0A1L9AVA2_9BACT|nr:tuba protein [Cystobacter ferrugineus]OJH33926.1 tuba protein [Cystobacter ferrugineus]
MDRVLGPTEQVFYKVRRLRPFNIAITARVSGRVSEARVREALPVVQRRHPLLQANILAESPPRFSRASVPALPLEVVPREHADSWLARVDQQINLPFDASRGPLARFVLVQGDSHSELICGYDHLIGDALSGCFVLRDLLRAMAPGSERLPELQARPAYEDLIGPPLPGTGVLNTVVSRSSSTLLRVSPALNRLSARLASDSSLETPADKVRSGFVYRRLPPAQTERLLTLCRERQSSLHGLLGAALLLARAESLSERKSSVVTITSALDARARFGVGEDFGLFTTGKTHLMRVRAREELWTLSRQLRAPLVAARKNASHLRLFRSAIEMSSRTVDLAAQPWMQRCTRLGLDSMLGLSNLGRLNLEARYGDLSLEGVGFSGSVASHFDIVLAAATFAQHLDISFLYNPPLMRPEMAERIASRTCEVLAEAAR